ncbi:TonB-dependent receptor [Hephaestia sp. GCM10023244]|uniref:TonB-dependent receptor n=1 Tax=unclassified Hephaestia TaxID=2631281 RepID=UPI00207772D1|nr:TonB-dependent receptor [Hephaestia sp. MAHUQ-44]MCM8729812.1 TonB-dependent receptor [Hephaestia sp. MAHUQ-44]
MVSDMIAATRRWACLALLGGTSALAFAAAPAGAQTTPAQDDAPTPSDQVDAARQDTVGAIIVTAQRRAERDIDVPLSVTAFDARMVENLSASFLIDVGTKVPNVQFTPGTNSPGIAIRGVSSQSNINAGFPPAIGVYVDEVYQGRDPTFNTILNDIERVEVLRGPQGTLYGKNTIGGAINIVTRDPTNAFGFSGDLNYGNYNFVQARGSLGGAIVEDKLLIRLSGVHRQRDGFIRNTTTGEKLNDLNSDGARAVVVANISPAVTLRLSADYFGEEGTTALETGPVTLAALPAFAGIPPQDASDNIVQLNAPEFARRELYGFSGRFDIDMGPAMLTSITAWRRYTSDFNDDSDGLPIDAFEVGRQENGTNFSQELRLTSTGSGALSWITGFYYYAEDTRNHRRIALGDDMPLLLVGDLAGVVFPGYGGEQARTDSRIDGSSWALFGSTTYKLTDRLSLTAGLRYTHERKDLTYEQRHTQVYSGGLGGSIIPNFAVAIPERRERYTDNRLTGDASLSYAFSPDHVGYLRFSRGFKAGGFQTDVISPPFGATDRLGFDPETVDNYEAGFKSYLFGHKVRFNIAAFLMDWRDKQEQIFTGLSFLIRNAANARSKGMEVEISAQPVAGLSLDANLGYLDTRYTDFPGNSLEGRHFPNLPKWTWSTGAQYTAAVSSDFELTVRGDVNHRGETYNQPNTNVFVISEGLTTINSRLGVQRADGQWGVYLWGRNLADVKRLGIGSSFPFPNATITTRNAGFGRTFGAELRVNF